MIKARSTRFQIPMLLCAAMTAIVPMTTAVSAAEPAKQAAVPTEPVNTTATYGNWVLHCARLAPAPTATESKGSRVRQDSCEVVQSVQVRGQAQPVLQLAIGHLPGEKAFTITAVLPINVTVPGRVHISTDGKPDNEEKGGLDLALKRCVPGGCLASAPLGEKMRTLMSAGTQGQLRFIDAGSQTVGVPLSWVGLAQALSALESKS